MTEVMDVVGEYTIEEAILGERERMSNLTILETEPNDASGYTCVADNGVDSVIGAAILTVHGTLDHRSYSA